VPDKSPFDKARTEARTSEALRQHYREQHIALYGGPAGGAMNDTMIAHSLLETPGENFSPPHSEPRAVGKSPLFAMDFGNAEARITAFVEATRGAELAAGVFRDLVYEFPIHWWGRDAQIWSLWHQHKITWQERNDRLRVLEEDARKRYAK
jgi:hypothetical protein